MTLVTNGLVSLWRVPEPGCGWSGFGPGWTRMTRAGPGKALAGFAGLGPDQTLTLTADQA